MIFISQKQIDVKNARRSRLSIEEKNLYDLHIVEKLAMREEENKDKLITNEKCLLVVFEMR